jgi:tetratricopeptide (TPR) repeat protein
VNEKFSNRDLVHRSYHAFGTFINHFQHHACTSIDYQRKGYQYSIANGDIIFAGYCGDVIIYYRLLIGHPLDDTYAQSQSYLDFVVRAKDQDTADNLIVSQQTILHLQGKTVHPTSFSSAQYDEESHVAHMQSILMKLPLHWYYIMKLRSLYLFEDYRAALEMAQKSAALLHFSAGLLQVAEHYFYDALTLATLYPEATVSAQTTYWELLTTHQAQMHVWAVHALDNFAHKHLLIAAEIAGLSGHLLEALDLYDQAIMAATAAAYTQNAALANELAAKLYLQLGRRKAARAYVRDAHYGYVQWGALAKVKQLEEQHPHLLARPATPSTALTTAHAAATPHRRHGRNRQPQRPGCPQRTEGFASNF